MTPQEIKALIEAGIDDCDAIVKGDDGQHFEAVVVSDAFVGLSLVKKHQLIYKALGDKMKAEIHALSMKPYTREEWDKDSGLRVL